MSSSRLWQPLQVGNVKISQRIAMAPLTRYRNDSAHMPTDMQVQYYSDRACVPGTLLISEATGISHTAEAAAHLPSVSTEAHAAGWKKVYDAVHARGSFMFQQLWDLGRAGDPAYLKSRGYKYSSSSAVQQDDRPEPPEPLTEEEIWQKVDEFRAAARRVVDAGGDGVEIHGAHGYLIDQFTRDSINKRTDGWGGSTEKRARFLLEVVKAVVGEIGAERTALRLSPFSTFQGSFSSDPWEQSMYIIKALKEAGYQLAYLSFVEWRGNLPFLGIRDALPAEYHQFCSPTEKQKMTLNFLLEVWDNQSPVVVAGDYSAESASSTLDGPYEKWDVVIAFGRPFIANPDLVFRVKHQIPFTPYDRSTFYTVESNKGYNDYPFSQQYLESVKK